MSGIITIPDQPLHFCLCLFCPVTTEGNYHWIDRYHQSVLNLRRTFQASSLSFYSFLVSSFYSQLLFQYSPFSPIPLLTSHFLTLGHFMFFYQKSWDEHPYTYFYFTSEFFLNSKLPERVSPAFAVIFFTFNLPLELLLYHLCLVHCIEIPFIKVTKASVLPNIMHMCKSLAYRTSQLHLTQLRILSIF